MSFNGVAIIIPTRNRAGLAKRAILSVLEQPLDDFRVLVSDNSTSSKERAELSRFCKQISDERLQYVVPPQPLPMAAHWQWALDQCFSYSVSHFTYLSDRIIFKPGALRTFAQMAEGCPDSIVTTMHDTVLDDQQPVRIRQHECSGKLYAIKSSRLLHLVSQSVLHECLPRMLNCMVPRRILNDIKGRFGNVFSSIAPDFNFCFRSLVTEKRIVFCDSAFFIHYALHRSNGASTARGEMTADHADFLANVGRSVVYTSAPIPELVTVLNAIIHEYCAVKEETRSPKMPDVDWANYLLYLASEIDQVADTQRRLAMQAILASRSWKPAPPGEPVTRKLLSPRKVAKKLGREVKNASSALSTLIGINRGSHHQTTSDVGVDSFGHFATSEEALEYSIKFPRAPSQSLPPETKSMLDAKEVSIRPAAL